MKGVMRFGKKGKLSPGYVGLYRFFSRIDKWLISLSFPRVRSASSKVFHVYMLHKCLGDPFHITHIEDVR
ncbi:hypothetical protein RND71_005642 [Anisodus tanguticus]|uniref:Tf2-1-like SH3-like domain-containing protein n=1 Tax=Anisodus tanguticus TaxID=243964 RepID=A0AAE1VVM6_9SOLA|nr:hypothetical protein RND71_005642 [Anisodus tanguticus]